MNIRDFHNLRFDVSKKPYDFSKSLGERAFRRNVFLFSRHLGIKPREIYFMKQIHSDHIVCLDEAFSSEDYFGYRIVLDTDALVTSKPGIALVSRVSDCTPVLLFDPVHRVQACIHSGWRPTVKKLPQKTLRLMAERYGTDPAEVYAYIGPSIGRKSFQVGKEVSAAWREAFSFADEVIRYEDRAHDYIDLKRTHGLMLREMGLPDSHITVHTADTFTDPRYHSYRRDRPFYGSNALISMLKN